MDPVEKLLAIESIKQTKAKYWYFMDTKNWDELAKVFTEDCIFDMRGERAFSLRVPLDSLPPVEQAIADKDEAVTVGAKNIAAFIRAVVEKWITVHHGHAPIIEITGTATATGIWPLFDYIDDGKNALKGYGHYHEKYRKVGDKWLISHSAITRLHSQGTHPWSAK